MLDDKNFEQELIKRWEKGLTFGYFNAKNS